MSEQQSVDDYPRFYRWQGTAEMWRVNGTKDWPLWRRDNTTPWRESASRSEARLLEQQAAGIVRDYEYREVS